MAITDATTSLDLAWAEESTVSFTAGTLADVDSMVTEVESKLSKDRSLTLRENTNPKLTSVQRWLVKAKETLMQAKSYSFARRFASASLTADDYRIALPPDYNGGNVRVRLQSNNSGVSPFTLLIWPANKFDLKFPDPDEEENNEPRVCCIKNRELWLWPPAIETCTVHLEYDRSGDDNTATDFSFLPEVERFLCCDYAIYQSFLSLQKWAEAGIFKSEWLAGLGISKKADVKRKWQEIGWRAIGILEQESARYYQK